MLSSWNKVIIIIIMYNELSCIIMNNKYKDFCQQIDKTKCNYSSKSPIEERYWEKGNICVILRLFRAKKLLKREEPPYILIPSFSFFLYFLS